jgi:hypothetical protein
MAQPEPPVFTGLFSVNGATRLYGTIGDPIRQLRMTGIMPQVFAAVGVNAVWLPFEGGAPLLQLMLDALRGRMRNLAGFTVTIPHKTAVVPLLDRISPRAQATGWASCGGWKPRAIGCTAPASGWSASAGSAGRSLQPCARRASAACW